MNLNHSEFDFLQPDLRNTAYKLNSQYLEKQDFGKITLILFTKPSKYFIMLYISKNVCYLHQNSVEQEWFDHFFSKNIYSHHSVFGCQKCVKGVRVFFVLSEDSLWGTCQNRLWSWKCNFKKLNCILVLSFSQFSKIL